MTMLLNNTMLSANN